MSKGLIQQDGDIVCIHDGLKALSSRAFPLLDSRLCLPIVVTKAGDERPI